MIRMIPSKSAGQAKTYFSDALTKSDYYLDEQEFKGSFHGRLANRIGLSKEATKEAFFDLCENINPVTKQKLTPRSNDGRIVGYDINFHCPKSVSLVQMLTKNSQILEAFETSVNETMQEIETDVATRVRQKGQIEDRKTGELLWAQFTHQTARPVKDQEPDFHLHTHCFVFNATYDETENKIKAGKFRDIKIDMPYYQARYQKRFSDKLIELGYQIKRSENSFEIDGVPKKYIEHFSKRTDEIGRTAKEQGIFGAKALDQLGAKTRGKKKKGTSMEQLKQNWKEQLKAIKLSLAETKDLAPIRTDHKRQLSNIKVTECIDFAVKHCFERASVMSKRRVVEKAFLQAIGNSQVSLDAITKSFEEDNRLIKVDHGTRTMLTTKQVLLEEKEMIELARKGRGSMVPLYKQPPEIELKEEQGAAIAHVLTTPNLVSIIKGSAGTGKTKLMQEAVKHIEGKGKKVIVVAPTAAASRGVLKSDGFDKATTVADLLTNKKLQNELKDQILWVDEAGILGTNDMLAVIKLATAQKAKIILGGDTKQHSSVIRGDALRILNTVAGITSAEVSKIYRQKDNPAYRSVVEDLSKGDIKSSFETLDEMGSIKTVDPLNPYAELVYDYMKVINKGKSALIISPTHKQADKITERIRDRMKNIGKLGKKELSMSRLVSKNFTEAEKSDWRRYQVGQSVIFNQNLQKAKMGSKWSVKEIKPDNIIISDVKGQTIVLPKQKSKYFDVFEQKQIAIAKGDKIRITKNTIDDKKKRLDNGTSLEVLSIDKDGNLLLRNKVSKTHYTVDKSFGHLTHDYCVTSHASQGKTVSEIFIAQPASTFEATNMKQFYVSVSRGKDMVHIYTDDKAALLESASKKGDRMSAHELILGNKPLSEYVLDQQRSELHHFPKAVNKDVDRKTLFNQNKEVDRDYEPGF